MKNISIPSGDLSLEARFRSAGPDAAGPAAVICHPHPEFGGSMDNNVVFALEAALSAAGFSTLCFNFRGVGGSEGRYDNMQGEVDDAIAAWQWLADRPETEPSRMTLAGYSFGAYIAIRAASRLIEAREMEESSGQAQPPAAIRLVSPMPGPPGWEQEVGPLWSEQPSAKILTGEFDDICTPTFARGLADRLAADLAVIPGGDHFYAGREREIAKWIV